MTHYIHNIDPILLHIHGNIAVRWYGFSYLLGFVASILMLRRWSQRGEFEVPKAQVSDFVVMLALFGVFIGGRLGYALFYSPDLFLDFSPIELFGRQVPVWGVFKVWDGGMASHGGFIGVILFVLWYVRKHGYSFWNIIDNFAATTSLGLAFGRIANFINGELWGRVTSVKWGVIFPQSGNPPLRYGEYDLPMIREMVEKGLLQPRHSSQLYQAACEGFLLFGIMLLLRRTAWGRCPGALSAAYLVLYALARIAMEFFREPDNGQFFIAWITKGQFYSALMIIGALLIAWRKKLFKPQPA